jgi:monofunctional glycosyltransferase
MLRRATPAGAPCSAITPTPLAAVSPLLPRMVILGEDSRFWTHHGVDLTAVREALGLEPGRGLGAALSAAWRHRDRLRGASTITQQLAKNLYLSPTRSVLRKVKEAVTALRLELALPKQRILELYLDVAQWGPHVWGAAAASRVYFGVPAARLDELQAAELAATLPHPRTSNPAHAPERTLARRDLILARYYGVDVYLPPAEEESDRTASEAPAAPEESLPEAGPPPDTAAVGPPDSLAPVEQPAAADSARPGP